MEDKYKFKQTKWLFSFEFYDYINNIENHSPEDDLEMYERSSILYNSRFLSKKSYPILKTVNIFKNRFPELLLDVEGFSIYIEGNECELKKYILLITNLGYKITNKYDENDKVFSIYIKPKYDFKVCSVPNILYFTSPVLFKRYTLENGIIYNRNYKFSKNKENVFLTDDLELAVKYGINIDTDYIFGTKINTGYCIYEIDGSFIKNLYRNLKDDRFKFYGKIEPNDFKLIIEKNNE